MGLSISELIARFEYYAKNLKEISHDPLNRHNNRFFHVDLESIQDALTNGISFPALYIQTPEVDKAGSYDNLSEQYNFTYIVVKPLNKKTKAQIFEECKITSDKVLNRLLGDVSQEIIPGVIEGTNEGAFGPVGDGLYGWAKSISVVDGYSAELVSSDWEDMP